VCVKGTGAQLCLTISSGTALIEVIALQFSLDEFVIHRTPSAAIIPPTPGAMRNGHAKEVDGVVDVGLNLEGNGGDQFEDDAREVRAQKPREARR
jgi:hypothetical protein